MTAGSKYGITEHIFMLNPFLTVLAIAAALLPHFSPASAQEIDNIPPAVSRLFPATGATVRSLSQVEVSFDEDVLGMRASDLLINGRPATNLTQRSGGPFVFRFPAQPAGPVRMAWAANHAITDAAPIPNPFNGASWNYTVDPSISWGDLVITEFLASSAGVIGYRDEEGDIEDWIEIYNKGANPVNLANWSLSDDPDDPGMWVFPARTIVPGEYLVVFASGKDRDPANATAKLHTNFKLSDVGEHLGLYTPDSPRVLASGFTKYPEQRNDVSYGIDPSGKERFYVAPTPGKANGASTVEGLCAPIHLNVTRGFYSTPFDLILSCATPGVVFRYTTNGSEPSIESPAFPASLPINRTTLFRAAAFKENFLPSKTETHTYLFNLTAALRSLPIVSIVTASNNLYGKTGILGINGGNYNAGTWAPNPGATNDFHNPSKHGVAWERPTSIEWIRPEDNSGFQVMCGIRVQGSDYQRPRLTRTSKFSFRLYFRGDYGPGRLEYPLFPFTTVERFDQLVLRAGFNEQTNPFIRDELHRRLSDDMGDVASHGNLAIVLVNGIAYAGSPWYNPCERVHEEFMQEHVGGGAEWDVVGPSFGQTAGVPGVIDGDRADFQSMVNYVRTQSPTNPVIYQEISRRLELTNFVDYCLLNAYAAMGDWPANNWRAARERSPNGIWRFIVWDAEWGMGIYDRTSSINCFTQTGGGPNDSGLGSVASSEIAQMYDRLRASAEFRLLWADRVQKHFFNGGALTGANITNRFEQMRRELLVLIPSMDTKILQWARDRQAIFFRHMQPYRLEASSNAPVFSRFGGPVAPGFKLAMTNLAGTIYYTVDGSDPRVRFTSEISKTAIPYAEPIVLGSNVLIRARALQDTNWSAIVEAPFTVGSIGIPLRITEIMYNPPAGSGGEFIELQNIGGATLDLGRMSFSGIDFVFNEGSMLAAGARLVLASSSDTNLWNALHPGTAVAGWFGGSLNNGGERIALLDRFGNDVTAVTYKDGAGWPLAADGSGKSLEIIHANADPNDPANWRASSQNYGSPGAPNSAPPSSVITINEVMAENLGAVKNIATTPDWIELYNSGTNTVNLSGWSLSDDGNPRKFVLPAVTIPAQGYAVVWCDPVNTPAPGMHSGFSLDRDGESIFLYDPSTNRLDAFTFGRQIGNLSVGRVGGEWVLTKPTPNAENQAASVSSATNLVLNEWMANPFPGQSDWIELYNSSKDAPVALHGLYLGGSNVVRRIEPPSFLEPGGYLQIFADESVAPQHIDLKLPPTGGVIALYDENTTLIQRVVYGIQTNGISQGRLPDGNTNQVAFPGSASPGSANYTATYTGPILNEVLARSRSVKIGGTVSDFIELYNPTPASFNLAGMSLSVNKPSPGKWMFPAGATLASDAHLVIACDGSRAASAIPGSYNLGESLDGDNGGAYLFNAAGQLVNGVEYGFQIEDLPIGRSGGQWVLLSAATPGATNAAPAILGQPSFLRINEWLANPVSGPDWFELYNSTNQPEMGIEP